MRISELIRGILDIIDGKDVVRPDEEVPNEQFYDDEVRRFRQIVDLADNGEQTEYSNTPREEYAGIEAVTSAAGGGPNKPKHVDDIRGNSFRIHGDN